MAHKIIKTADREQWLKQREAGIGSSAVGTILGVNPYDTPYKYWRRKVGLDPAVEENFLMKAGHYLEDAVSKFFADETGADIIKASAGDFIVYDPEHPWRRVSPDRMYWTSDSKHSNGNKRILECKTTQMDVDENSIPSYWFCQLQYQMGVAEIQHGALAWLKRGREFGYKEIKFDKDFFEWMMNGDSQVMGVDRFYQYCIVEKNEPDLQNVDDVVAKFPRSIIGKTVPAYQYIDVAGKTMSARDCCVELRMIKDQQAELNTRKEAYEDALKTYMEDAEAIVADINGKMTTLCTWKTAKDSMKFNAHRFAADNPLLAAEYTDVVKGTRRFLIK